MTAPADLHAGSNVAHLCGVAECVLREPNVCAIGRRYALRRQGEARDISDTPTHVSVDVVCRAASHAPERWICIKAAASLSAAASWAETTPGLFERSVDLLTATANQAGGLHVPIRSLA